MKLNSLNYSILFCSLFVSSSVNATLIDTGRVNPSNSAVQANYDGVMTVGRDSNGIRGDGTFEVNTSTVGNGLSSANNKGLIVGSGTYTGRVDVIGDGRHNSASINIQGSSNNSLQVGNYDSTGQLNISGGGLVDVQSGGIDIGNFGGSAEVNIDGSLSGLRASAVAGNGGRIMIENSSTVNISNGGFLQTTTDDTFRGFISIDGTGNTATVNLSSGAIMSADSSISVADFGGESFGNAYINANNGTVLGGNSIFIASYTGDAKIFATNSSRIEADEIQIGSVSPITGYTANGIPVNYVSFGDVGQQATSANGEPLFYKDGSPVLIAFNPVWGINMAETAITGNRIYEKRTGEFIVENSTSVTAQTINVSDNGAESDNSIAKATTYNNKESIFTVRSNSTVNSNVNVYTDGLLNGDGTIVGNVVVDGGTVAPGNSPGTLKIDGNADFLNGFLELEVTQAAMDLLDITGDLTLGEDLMVSLIFDFDPINYVLDLNDFFNVGGDIVLQNFNLENNLDFVGVTSSTNLTVNFGADQKVYGGQTQASVPEPASILLFGFGLLGIRILKRYSVS